jgi:hypothetical protein
MSEATTFVATTGVRHILAPGHRPEDRYPKMLCGVWPDSRRGQGAYLRDCEKCKATEEQIAKQRGKAATA